MRPVTRFVSPRDTQCAHVQATTTTRPTPVAAATQVSLPVPLLFLGLVLRIVYALTIPIEENKYSIPDFSDSFCPTLNPRKGCIEYCA